MLWVLIWSPLMRPFLWVPTTYVFVERYQKNITHSYLYLFCVCYRRWCAEQLRVPGRLCEFHRRLVGSSIFLHRSRYCAYATVLSTSLSITKTCLFKYTGNFTCKKWKLLEKKIWYFSYFCSRRQFCWVPTIYVFLAEIRKIMYTPVNPSFTI